MLEMSDGEKKKRAGGMRGQGGEQDGRGRKGG